MALKLGELTAYLRADDTQFQKSLRQAKQDWEQHGEGLKQSAAVMGVAIAAALGAGLLGAMDVSKAQAKLAAQMGSEAWAKDLGQVAGDLYTEGFGQSVAENMAAVRAVMSTGLLPEGASNEAIRSITRNAQALADAFDLDVVQAARAAGQMIRTGLAANAEEAFDILVRGFQETGDPAGDLLDTFSEYSTQFRKLGLDGRAAMALLEQGLQGGARDLDIVADALKEFSIRAIDGTEASAEGYKLLGLNAERMTAQIARGGDAAKAGLDVVLDRLRAIEDPVKRDAAGVALFGTQWEDMGAAVLALDLDKAADGLGKVDGAAGKLGDTLQNSAGARLEAFKRRAQEALVNKLAEALPTIEKVAGWIERNSDLVGALAIVLGTIGAVIGIVTIATKAWAIAQMALNIAMMLNPIGLIVLAVIGLIAIIIGLWMRFEGFRKFWIAVWEAIKTAAVAVWDFLVAAFELWWKTFSGFWLGVGRFFKGLWNGIVDGVKAAWKWITGTFDKVVDFVGALPGRLRAKAAGMWDGIKTAFKSAVNWIIRKWNDLSFRIPGVSVPGIGQVWGGATLSTPNIPMLADGGHILRAGTAVVGERGPELVHLGRGATVQPLASGQAMAGLIRLLLSGEFRIRGGDLVLVLREQVAVNGGNVQQVVGSE